MSYPENQVQFLLNTNSNAKLNLSIKKCDIFDDKSCIATYPFDGNAKDICGKYNGTWVGNEQYNTGKFGQAVKFDGNSYITIPAPLTTLPMTISLWINTTQQSINNNDNNKDDWANPTLIGFATNGSETNDFGIEIKNGYLHIFSGFGVETYHTTSKFVSDGKWHLITVVFDKNTCNIYVDRTKIDSISQNSSKITSVATWYFGAMYNYANSSIMDKSKYIGLIDQVRIFNKVLSEEEIKTLYTESNYDLRFKIGDYVQDKGAIINIDMELNKDCDCFKYNDSDYTTIMNFTFEIFDENTQEVTDQIPVLFIPDFINKKIYYYSPGFFNEMDYKKFSVNLPNDLDTGNYTFTFIFAYDYFKIQLSENGKVKWDSNPIEWDLLKYFNTSKMKDLYLKVSTGNTLIDEAFYYYNNKDKLNNSNQSFLYEGLLNDPNYIGCIPFDIQSANIKTFFKSKIYTDGISVKLHDNVVFKKLYKQYRYFLGYEGSLKKNETVSIFDLIFNSQLLKNLSNEIDLVTIIPIFVKKANENSLIVKMDNTNNTNIYLNNGLNFLINYYIDYLQPKDVNTREETFNNSTSYYFSLADNFNSFNNLLKFNYKYNYYSMGEGYRDIIHTVKLLAKQDMDVSIYFGGIYLFKNIFKKISNQHSNLNTKLFKYFSKFIQHTNFGLTDSKYCSIPHIINDIHV